MTNTEAQMLNASKNLRDCPFLSENNTVSSTEINAFGENVTLSDEVGTESSLVELGIKQEAATNRFL